MPIRPNDPELLDSHDFERESKLPQGYFDRWWERCAYSSPAERIADRIIVWMAIIGVISLFIARRMGWV